MIFFFGYYNILPSMSLNILNKRRIRKKAIPQKNNWQLRKISSKIFEPTLGPIAFTVIFCRSISFNNGLKAYGQNLAHIRVDNDSNKHLMMIICVLFFSSLFMDLFTTIFTMYFFRRKKACCVQTHWVIFAQDFPLLQGF